METYRGDTENHGGNTEVHGKDPEIYADLWSRIAPCFSVPLCAISVRLCVESP